MAVWPSLTMNTEPMAANSAATAMKTASVNPRVMSAASLAAVSEVALAKGDLPAPGSALMFRFGTKPALLILDEPTASLNETDSEKLLQLLLQFKSQGIASILISHKLSEVSKVADSITILRDGATIETLEALVDAASAGGTFAVLTDRASDASVLQEATRHSDPSRPVRWLFQTHDGTPAAEP